MGIFTEPGVLCAKYREEKLMEHLKLFTTRVNVPKLIRVCDELRQRPWRWLGDGGQRKAEGEREDPDRGCPGGVPTRGARPRRGRGARCRSSKGWEPLGSVPSGTGPQWYGPPRTGEGGRNSRRQGVPRET